VFKNLAQRGKTSVDWFFGFKLHLVVNERGELLNVILTPGNVDDRKPIPEILANIFGTVFADRGYVSAKLATQLLEDFGIHFFAKPRRNMKNQLMRLNFCVNVLCGLIAYCHQPKKPSLQMDWVLPQSA